MVAGGGGGGDQGQGREEPGERVQEDDGAWSSDAEPGAAKLAKATELGVTGGR